MTTDVFRAIADPTRRAMLEMLRQGEHTATELAAPFRMSRPAASQHLAVLAEAGLVEFRPEGRHRVYTLTPGRLRDVFEWAADYVA